MGNARRKLNVAYLNGILLVAAVSGLIAESWIIFALVLAVLAGGGVYGGEIRPSPRNR
jgi:hypothetical protein